MSLIAFAPGIHVLTGIVIETQRLNTISSLTQNNGKLQTNTKRIQYESTQYIYIDISEEFHQKKLREKKQLELRQLEMQKKQNENEEDMQEVDTSIGDDEKEGIDEDEADVGIEQQIKHRGSMELNMNETMNFDEEEEKDEEQKVTDDQDKEKLISEMKPIGHHQKSEDQILKEMIQEEQTEIQSMTPLESTEHADFDKNEEQTEEQIQDQNVSDDGLDVPPLEIQQQEEEKQSPNDAETQQENTTV